MSSSLSATLLPQVINAINTYGIEVTVLRNVYSNELGVKTLQQAGLEVARIKVVIDNSKYNSTSSNKFRVEGIIHPQQTAMIYYAYDSKVNLQREDYIIVDDVKYILDVPQNILHYNVLYQVLAEVTINE